MIRMVRDLLAIFGALAIGWCLWSWHARSDRAFTEGLIVAVIGLVFTMVAISADHRYRSYHHNEVEKFKLRNAYLEAAIKQLGGE